MTNIAVTQLQQQIEALRREAFAEGYAAAMRQVRDFAARPLDDSAPSRPAPFARSGHARATADRQHPQRSPHGTNARMVAAVLESIAPRAARPSEIRHLLRKQGVTLAFTSIRHALGQLTARRAVERVAESKTWRYLRAGDAAEAADD